MEDEDMALCAYIVYHTTLKVHIVMHMNAY